MDPNKKSILAHVEELSFFMYECRARMNQKWRHTVWRKCMELLQDFSRLVTKAYLSKEERVQALMEGSEVLEQLGVFLTLAYDLKVINQEKHTKIQEMLVEVGKIIGGWLQKTKSRENI